MGIISYIKGKMKQKEARNLTPDKEFQFKENYYGDINVVEGFKFIYCNNYTDKLFKDYTDGKLKSILSFISCVITLPKNEKTLQDTVIFLHKYYNYKYYINKQICVDIIDDYIKIYIRGNIDMYMYFINNITNNIIIKYIKNNIFPNGSIIDTPNEFLDKLLGTINHPEKDIDILFIEDKIECKEFTPIIGLSLRQKRNNFNSDDYDKYIITCNINHTNNREIIYIPINELKEWDYIYLIENVKHGDKLPDLLHINIEDDIDLDIDEIIE